MTADEQIDHIARMMTEGRWKGGRSQRELAKAWGIHPRTVADRALIASGFLARVGTDLERWVLGKLAELEHQQAVAMSLKRPFKTGEGPKGTVEMLNAPNVEAANRAVELQLRIRGVGLTKGKAPTAEQDENWAKLTHQQRVAELERALAEERGKAKEEMQ